MDPYSNPFAGFTWQTPPQSFGQEFLGQEINHRESNDVPKTNVQHMPPDESFEEMRTDGGGRVFHDSKEDSFFDMEECLDFEDDEEDCSQDNDSGITRGESSSPENNRRVHHDEPFRKGNKRLRRTSSASSSDFSSRYDRIDSNGIKSRENFGQSGNKRRRNGYRSHTNDASYHSAKYSDREDGFLPLSTRQEYPIDLRGYLTWKRALSCWETRYPNYMTADGAPFVLEAIGNLQERIQHFEHIQRNHFSGYIFNFRRKHPSFPKLTEEEIDKLMSYTSWRHVYERCEQSQMTKPSQGNLEQMHNISVKMHRVEEAFGPENLLNCLFAIGVDVDSM